MRACPHPRTSSQWLLWTVIGICVLPLDLRDFGQLTAVIRELRLSSVVLAVILCRRMEVDA